MEFRSQTKPILIQQSNKMVWISLFMVWISLFTYKTHPFFLHHLLFFYLKIKKNGVHTFRQMARGNHLPLPLIPLPLGERGVFVCLSSLIHLECRTQSDSVSLGFTEQLTNLRCLKLSSLSKCGPVNVNWGIFSQLTSLDLLRINCTWGPVFLEGFAHWVSET